VALAPAFTLARQQFDQVWYMRPVQLKASVLQALAVSGGIGSNPLATWNTYYTAITGITISDAQFGTLLYYLFGNSGSEPYDCTYEQYVTAIIQGGVYNASVSIVSRRSKVIRVHWPTVPAPPLFYSYQSGLVQFTFNGDIRNIYGFELRTQDVNGNTYVLYQQPCPSVANLNVDIFQGTPLLNIPGYAGLNVSGYFFNQNWVYSSEPCVIPVAALLPPAPIFGVGLGNYGLFGITGIQTPGVTIDGVTIDAAEGEDLQQMMIILVYCDETQASLLNGSLPSDMDATTDPYVFNPNIFSSGGLNFNVGDYIVWNDPTPISGQATIRSYECDLITGISTGGMYTLQRHFPGTPANQATFESLLSAHLAGTKFYQLKYLQFPQSLQTGTPQQSGNQGSVPSVYWLTLPVACVVAAMASFANTNGYGPWEVVNCANVFYPSNGPPPTIPPAPGGRTLTGAAYFLTAFGASSGALMAGQRSDVLAQLVDNHSIRTIDAYLHDAGGVPVGGSGIVVNVKYIEPMQPGYTSYSQRREGVIEQLVIPAGQGTSWNQQLNPPNSRRMPYVHGWPTTDIMGDDGETLILQQDGSLDLEIVSVGSSTPGSGLIIAFQT
jgi:hypothetical protein